MKPIATFLLLAIALPAPAQQDPADPATVETPRPDIEFAADVHMDVLRFGSDPQARVTLRGGPRLQPRHDVERIGLPRPVQGGRTYRDVTVRTTISATLLDPAADPAPPVSPTLPPAPEDLP